MSSGSVNGWAIVVKLRKRVAAVIVLSGHQVEQRFRPSHGGGCGSNTHFLELHNEREQKGPATGDCPESVAPWEVHSG